MTQLIQYPLDADKALKYIHWNFKNGNTLCEGILKHTPFAKGSFFTFLKEGLPKETLNKFRSIHVGGNAKEQMAQWLHEKLLKDEELITIFDEDDADYNEEANNALFLKFGVHNQKEVYYLLSKNEASKKHIQECLYASDIIWHSLCIVSKYPYRKNKDQGISNKELESIAKEAEIILVLAYDAEGYIIWKRNSE